MALMMLSLGLFEERKKSNGVRSHVLGDQLTLLLWEIIVSQCCQCRSITSLAVCDGTPPYWNHMFGIFMPSNSSHWFTTIIGELSLFTNRLSSKFTLLLRITDIKRSAFSFFLVVGCPIWHAPLFEITWLHSYANWILFAFKWRYFIKILCTFQFLMLTCCELWRLDVFRFSAVRLTAAIFASGPVRCRVYDFSSSTLQFLQIS